MAPSPPLSPTPEQRQALRQQRTVAGMFSSQQDNNPPRPSTCPMVQWKWQRAWTTPPCRMPSCKGHPHCPRNQTWLATQHVKICGCKLYCNFWQEQAKHLQCKQYKGGSLSQRHPFRWQCADTNLWRIPLVPHVTYNKTETILCNQLPTEFLP